MIRKFNDAEIVYLRGLRAVDNVTPNRIIYSKDFKRYFLREYWNGKGPTDIFRDAGLPVVLIGRKRIERCTYRWTKEGRDKDIVFWDGGENDSDDSTQGQHVERILAETQDMIKDLSSVLSRVETIIDLLKDVERGRPEPDIREGGETTEDDPVGTDHQEEPT